MGTLRLYTKQALSISEQIELLKSRDLNIADLSKAAKFLGEVSYFRFVQYLRPMEADKTTHQFKPNSKFEQRHRNNYPSITVQSSIVRLSSEKLIPTRNFLRLSSAKAEKYFFSSI